MPVGISALRTCWLHLQGWRVCGLEERTYSAVLSQAIVTDRNMSTLMPPLTEWCCRSVFGFQASTFTSVVCAAYGASECFTFRGGPDDVGWASLSASQYPPSEFSLVCCRPKNIDCMFGIMQSLEFFDRLAKCFRVRSCSWNVFNFYFKQGAMDEVQAVNASKCDVPSPESCRFALWCLQFSC
jgi:hypothetical protein